MLHVAILINLEFVKQWPYWSRFIFPKSLKQMCKLRQMCELRQITQTTIKATQSQSTLHILHTGVTAVCRLQYQWNQSSLEG